MQTLNPKASKTISAACEAFWKNLRLRVRMALVLMYWQKVKYIYWVFCRLEGGILKRLDEHREMTIFIEDHYPEMLEKHPCLKNWLDSQDVFLCQLEKIFPVGGYAQFDVKFRPGGCTYQDTIFPRHPRNRPIENEK